MTGVQTCALPIWNDVSGATGYTIEVTDGEFGPMSYISNASSTIHTVTSLSCGNTYHWRVRASDGSNISDWSEVWSFNTAPCSGISMEPFSKFIVYPNPAKNEFFIQIDDYLKSDRVEVYNTLGRLEIVQPLESPRIDISSLKSGVYLVVIRNNSFFVGQAKLIKE